MNSVQISNRSVLKLILQFLLENGLTKSYFTLSEECGVSLNWVESLHKIKSIINEGLWDELIKTLRYVKIPIHLQIIVFEHIALELLELKEPFVAQCLLESNKSIFLHNSQYTEKYNVLLEFIEKSKNIISNTNNYAPESSYSQIFCFVKNNYIEGGSKEKSRERLSTLISQNLVEKKKSMLLDIIGGYQKYNKYSKESSEELSMTLGVESKENTNLFEQEILQSGEQEANFFEISSAIIDCERLGYICCISFLPSGEQIVATSKGYVIIGNTGLSDATNRIFESKHIYSHCKDVKILGLCTASPNQVFSYVNSTNTDTERSERILIASTSERVDIKIWDYSTSNFIFIVNNVYEKHVTDFTFNKDATCILSSSIEGTIKIHGLKSERTIKYFPKNNEYFVNKISYNSSETMVISALSNGSVSVWDIKSNSCIATYDISCSQIIELKPINNLEMMFPFQEQERLNKAINTIDSFFIGTKSGMYILDISNGNVTNTAVGKCTQHYLSFTYNSRLNMIIYLLKNSKIMLFNVSNKNANKKEISLGNSWEYEQVTADQTSGNITIFGKNKLITFAASKY
ncbi:WD-40 repeat and SMART LisH domain-containing protein [Cryptosporidium canis]|uniref:WD40 repeat-containing protein SMU1 n=1 Tax=Cryptosporidium canis TaxID=195482 RepID=A0ABQ8P6G5_9CRYT|nr:WD-40 repeat and SMART LisH domain-containing protein [Cryptosporidium canis]KAJ1612670.1 WD-40 repeat and SMART LisH domain-containing protein [Cryptosporidium canis]